MKASLTRLLWLIALLACYGLGSTFPAVAVSEEKVVVIVNKDNAQTIDLAYVAKIYSGALRTWPDGSPVAALDQAEDSEIRAVFTQQVLNRTVANMRALWSQNIFAGKGLPPKVVSAEIELKRQVATNKNAIGYVRASQVDASVRVLDR